MKWVQIRWILLKELKQEWRQKFTVQGILLYALAATYVVYLSLPIMEKPAWNALFWVILVFSAVSAIAKSFLQESKGKMLYLHQLVHPASLLVAKILYNSILMAGISMLVLLAYSVLLGQEADHLGWFILAILLGSAAFASVLTMVSAIASKTGNGHLIMPVLSIPLLIPLLLIAVKASKTAVDGLQVSLLYDDLGVMLIFYVMVSLLGYVLYPWLWKE
ncbi:MAG: heme exporter protein CcmB [Bacteroidota bacterium]|nr:heme exporter protein CcmB [Bacteroidota bacterium]MDX5429603.1 heme exporter protein CcmB [Bacteroidota bacterium]MDX5468387.1 heme exporter protein CcmB [Bacteroidota bacterium]